jgi:hypothetical protein
VSKLARNVIFAALVSAGSSAGGTFAQDGSGVFTQLLEQSMKDKRGIKLYLNGETVAGAVVKIEGSQWVELRSQEFSRIVVRIDRINAIAVP